ncbi:hypothetical protein ABIA39_004425 [Nocardia sp. GAS34]|uniref:hypothetical protein n=1 Tax=unclassified Nocardia TaxID=2637762 RepID=UPI003D1C64B6
MKETLHFTVEQHRVDYVFDRTWGHLRILVDDAPVVTDRMLFSLQYVKEFRFAVGGHAVVITKRRRRFLAGFHDSEYRVQADGRPVDVSLVTVP